MEMGEKEVCETAAYENECVEVSGFEVCAEDDNELVGEVADKRSGFVR